MFEKFLKNTAILSLFILFLSFLLVFYTDFNEANQRKKTEEWSKLNQIIINDNNSRLNAFKIEFNPKEWNLLVNKLNNSRYFTILDEKYSPRYEYGFDAEYAKTLVDYWRTEYNWEKQITHLNRHPQFKLVINNEITIHYIRKITNQHLKLKPIKLIMIDGWPGSVYSFLNCLDYIEANYKTLSYDIIVPSIPGFGYSTPLTKTIDAAETAQYFDALMRFIHNDQDCEYFIHGEDWGSIIAGLMARLYPNRVNGIHITMPTPKLNDPISLFYSIIGQISPKLILTKQELDAGYEFKLTDLIMKMIKQSGYFHYQSTKPDTLAHAFTDSPLGLLAYILEKYSIWSFGNEAIGTKDGSLERLNRDDLLTIVTYYWMTSSISSSMRFYKGFWSGKSNELQQNKVSEQVPVAVEYFKNEVIIYPYVLLKRVYLNLKSFRLETTGGHFANFENPDLMCKDFIGFVNFINN